ncbi:MAG: serine/threonine-protein kinase [Chloroflexota bacterium]|nr:serine/threonine-protein kinase [Chloroflexota bacterium]
MLEPGVEFSHYRVVEHIGRGGMADVWSARDSQLNRTVAIKTIAPDLSIANANPVRLFEREAKTIAGLEHPNILPIYDFGSYEGQLYIVMRYVSGGSVEDALEDGALGIDEALRLARAIGQALSYAHDSKIIHLDLKPSNVLLDSYRSPYLADFGLATILDPEGRAKNPGSGTLLYMPPEQMTSEQLDHRADVFSYTIMLFHMITGTLPFDAAQPLALRQLQAGIEIPNPQGIRPSLPMALHEVLRKGTAMRLEDRTASIMGVFEGFEAVLSRVAQPNARAIPASRDTDLRTSQSDAVLIAPDAQGEEGDIGVLMRVPGGLNVDRGALNTQPGSGPEAMARREAEDIYKRARRAWARGQGRFLLGITHFMLIHDFYAQADANRLELDDAGQQMLLRGALEYDFQIDFWWAALDDDNRRWVALHAVLSENAAARTRALRCLEHLPDEDPPKIPKLVAQALSQERNKEAKLAALRVLETHAIRAHKRATGSVPSVWS